MKKWLLTIAIFLVSLSAIRICFGTDEPVRLNEILTYLGDGFDFGSKSLVQAIAYYQETSYALEQLAYFSTDEPPILHIFDQNWIAFFTNWLGNILNGFNIICNFLYVIFSDIYYLLRVFGYLVFAIPF